MDSSNNNKFTSFSESPLLSEGNSRDSSLNGNQWNENSREHRRDELRNGNRGRDEQRVRNECKEKIQKLQEEAYSLKCQLEAAQNEKIALQSDQEDELKDKDNQLSVLRTALQHSQREVLNLNEKRSQDEAELEELRAIRCRMQGEQNENNDLSHDCNDMGAGPSVINLGNDARLIGLISTFLHVHPFGASIHYITSYLYQFDSSVKVRDVENLMKRFPNLFKEESSGIGASLEKKWKFNGFKMPDTSNI